MSFSDFERYYNCDWSQLTTCTDQVSEPLTFAKLQETVRKIKGENMYPVEGCAPDRTPEPTPFERISRNEPLVALAIAQAEDLGFTRATNHYVQGEARSLERKLEETEDKLNRTSKELQYARNDVSYFQKEARSFEAKVKRLTPKKPAKKVVKKAK